MQDDVPTDAAMNREEWVEFYEWSEAFNIDPATEGNLSQKVFLFLAPLPTLDRKTKRVRQVTQIWTMPRCWWDESMCRWNEAIEKQALK